VRRNRSGRQTQGQVSYLREVAEERDLPFQRVHYPGHYGYFMAFAKGCDGEAALCSCAELAVRNYLALKLGGRARYDDPMAAAPLSSRHFPPAISTLSLLSSDPLASVRFIPGLCHRCNPAVPTLLWCHPMYGTEFERRYGWYTKQAMLRNGIAPPGPFGSSCLPDVCPPEWREPIMALESARRSELRERARSAAAIPPRSSRLREEMAKLKKRIDAEFENATRDEFGFARIGEGWVNETLMFELVQDLFPGEPVLHHYWPAWLMGLELDVFVPDVNLALEYQGKQHYEPVELWGGQEALDAQQKRDALKAARCKEIGVALLEVRHDDPLTREFLESMIRAAGIEVRG
jgi:hypothetical protein